MTSEVKAKKHRSPAYPFLGLESAIEKARQVYEKERTHHASVPVMAGHWGFKAKSSGGLQTAAALKQYGLLEESAGSGSERRVKLTELARQILLQPKASAGWLEAVKKAALNPPLYGELFSKWGASLPSDENFRTHLVLDRNFNEAAVDGVISNYKDTIGFAKLAESDNLSVGEADAVQMAQDDSDGRWSQPMETSASVTTRAMPPSDGVFALTVPFAKGTIAVQVRATGGQLTAAHLARVCEYLKLAESDLKESEKGHLEDIGARIAGHK